jgi:peptidyl-prolyl cis-trans isomerase C
MWSTVALLVFLLAGSAAFTPAKTGRRSHGSTLEMNFFQNLFGPKSSATASHILMDQKDKAKMMSIKETIEASSDVKKEFASQAFTHSKCPSSKNGGSLGKFKQGAMVPAFDKVVFSDEIGVVHGPIATPFGNHLILIESRDE